MHAQKNWKSVTWKFQYVYWVSLASLPPQQIGPETWELKNMKVNYTYCCDAHENSYEMGGFHGYRIRAHRVTHIYSG
jgi:hypothetical protein